MKPQTIGRVLGTGLRVAGRVAGQRMAASAQAAAASPAASAVPSAEQSRTEQVRAEQSRAAGQAAGKATRGVAAGVGGFLRPFQRVGGILWLEVTGVFFFLPVLVFAPVLWKTHQSWAHGPDHRNFVIAACIVALFFYLSASSFWRARRK